MLFSKKKILIVLGVMVFQAMAYGKGLDDVFPDQNPLSKWQVKPSAIPELSEDFSSHEVIDHPMAPNTNACDYGPKRRERMPFNECILWPQREGQTLGDLLAKEGPFIGQKHSVHFILGEDAVVQWIDPLTSKAQTGASYWDDHAIHGIVFVNRAGNVKEPQIEALGAILDYWKTASTANSSGEEPLFPIHVRHLGDHFETMGRDEAGRIKNMDHVRAKLGLGFIPKSEAE